MQEQLAKLIPKIDFHPLPIVNSKWMYIFDSSDWKHLAGEVKYIGIKVPGSRKFQEHYYSGNTINTFNSNTIGLSEGLEQDCLIPLPDGIYEVEVYLCQGTELKEVKLFYRYDQLQEAIDEKILQMSTSYKYDYNKFDDIYKLLEGSKSFARCGDFSQAMDLYNQVNDMLKYI
jgi:hypothetical protein